ncbi:MAG: hypothetical protein Q8O40_16415 [Chloroflexota bacterium]|nr:hypothetical protein [Chloroflexota bacterium]
MPPDQINAYLDKGYRARQIIQMGFKRQTVALYASKRMAPDGNKAKARQAPEGDEGVIKTPRSTRPTPW